jgi:dihydrofolate synthase / folylpolyglutamate synthase
VDDAGPELMTYEEALAYIASLAPRGWRLGLDRMQEFARRLGLEGSLGEPGGPQYIHVAGTNGKGSVTAYLQSMLIESGYSTGSFFSPFVYDPRERIQIGRRYIPKKILALLTQVIRPIGDSLADTEFGGVTEFEFKAALGFAFWKHMECEWVALEVGLGGRLDATNIVIPRCSVIVSIGLDHTNILGHTLAEIAHEKAGVIKPGIPVVVGSMPDEAREVIEAEAASQGAPVWLYGREVTVSADNRPGAFVVETPTGQHAGLHLGIPGAQQGHNMALAVAAMDASGATRTLGGLSEGSKKASVPGRFERANYRDRTVIFDGAHNSDAAKVLLESLRMYLWSRASDDVKVPTRVILVSGMVAGHDAADFYRELAPEAQSIHLVPIDFHRAVPPAQIAGEIRGLFHDIQVHGSPLEGLVAATEEAGKDDIILVTGSFYLVGEIGRAIGLGSEPTPKP